MMKTADGRLGLLIGLCASSKFVVGIWRRYADDDSSIFSHARCTCANKTIQMRSSTHNDVTNMASY